MAEWPTTLHASATWGSFSLASRMQDEMLRGVVIGELDRLFDGGRIDDDAFRDGLADEVDSGELARLGVDLGLDGGEFVRGEAEFWIVKEDASGAEANRDCRVFSKARIPPLSPKHDVPLR